RLRRASIRPTSLDASTGEDGDSSVGEVVGDERAVTPAQFYQDKADHGRLRHLIQKLPERERRILLCRFGLEGEDEHTLEELGKMFNLTRERIRQLQNEALHKLRDMMETPQVIPTAA
ncbi:MAG TPA: sigma-70 family RNA polymerase sigma factor, partial [Clostridia bacterium]|nr:sigma-70 family RNA polymerase sigma factor [Clostridia bacterium]